jgi:hypothetical protein
MTSFRWNRILEVKVGFVAPAPSLTALNLLSPGPSAYLSHHDNTADGLSEPSRVSIGGLQHSRSSATGRACSPASTLARSKTILRGPRRSPRPPRSGRSLLGAPGRGVLTMARIPTYDYRRHPTKAVTISKKNIPGCIRSARRPALMKTRG